MENPNQGMSQDEIVAAIRQALEEPQWIVDARWQAYFDAHGITNPKVADPRLCPICSNLGWVVSPDSWKIQACYCIRDLAPTNLDPEDNGQRQLEAVALAKYGCNYLTIRAERAGQ
jgi:hypothetical protein